MRWTHLEVVQTESKCNVCITKCGGSFWATVTGDCPHKPGTGEIITFRPTGHLFDVKTASTGCSDTGTPTLTVTPEPNPQAECVIERTGGGAIRTDPATNVKLDIAMAAEFKCRHVLP